MKKKLSSNIFVREVIIFFSAFLLVIMIGVFLVASNQYYKKKINSLQNKLIHTRIMLDSLPEDNVRTLYENVRYQLVVNYKDGEENYLIPKKEEEAFLLKRPEAVKAPIAQNGYAYFKGDSPFQNIFSVNSSEKNQISEKSDSSLVFEYVNYDKFKEYLKNNDYKEKFYKTFSRIYDWGSQISFNSKVDSGLIDSDNIEVLKSELNIQAKHLELEIKRFNKAGLDVEEVWDILLIALAIILVLIYPLRFLILGIRSLLKRVF